MTKGDLSKLFGENVSELVCAVTEKNRKLSWLERKEAALVEIANFSHDALLVKSADVISNNTELITDYKEIGDTTFARFNAAKEEIIGHSLKMINAILTNWPENPFKGDLNLCQTELERMK